MKPAGETVSAGAGVDASTEPRPSALYRAGPWRFALATARLLPRPLLRCLASAGALAYTLLRPDRLGVVKENLLPVVQGSDAPASRVARRLFREFGWKLADLWRYEAGRGVNDLFGELAGWDHYEVARRRGQGILLVTPHLGNWEFGAPLLAIREIRLAVVTLEEPGDGFTELRRRSRAREGVETFVVGRDPFGFVDLIRRLDEGATVALLLDRPPPATSVEVTLFGRPFRASIAAAELARATGCALLPVVLPRVGSKYAARILPEVEYDRPALRSREARVRLTGRLMQSFESAIREHPDQWFHFVPVWPPPSPVAS
jgi:KDO2-lipid IV(A) lauroyltransferase